MSARELQNESLLAFTFHQWDGKGMSKTSVDSACLLLANKNAQGYFAKLHLLHFSKVQNGKYLLTK